MSSFNDYFSNLYQETWPDLCQAMTNPESQIQFSAFDKNLDSYLKSPHEVKYSTHSEALLRSPQGHLQNYVLDPASLAPVYALEVNDGDEVLDLCAAPGGKSLALLASLKTKGKLLSNDSSPQRYARLNKVIRQYAPKDYQERAFTTNKDGTKFGFYHPDKFDKILVDVPCSSERHHIHQNTTSEWTLKRSKFLSVKQYTLLCAALLTAKHDATMVYSTCSINPVENDEVIRKFLKKKKDNVKLISSVPQPVLGSQATEFGQMIFPHTAGFGPIYYCALKVFK